MYCIICNQEIEATRKSGRPRKYCKGCEQYIPKSALSSGEYYRWWKFLITLNEQELQILFKKRKKECKYAQDKQRILQLRKEMIIINETYENIKKQKNNDI